MVQCDFFEKVALQPEDAHRLGTGLSDPPRVVRGRPQVVHPEFHAPPSSTALMTATAWTMPSCIPRDGAASAALDSPSQAFRSSLRVSPGVRFTDHTGAFMTCR